MNKIISRLIKIFKFLKIFWFMVYLIIIFFRLSNLHVLLDFIYKNPTNVVFMFYNYIKNKRMRTLFKVLRWFFYFFTIITWIIYMRGEILFEWNFELVKSIVIPWYLVFCGLMLWYLIATFWVWREKYNEEINKERIATRSFLIGIVCWIVFALLYVFVI